MLRLRTFGGLLLEDGGRPGTGAAGQRAPLAILAFIATAAESGVSRDRITALFWPESDTERARGSLKQALYQLRRAVGGHDLTIGHSTLQLNPDVVSADVSLFSKSISAHEWEAAVQLYTGIFLDGVHLPGNPEFEHWVDRERSRLAHDHLSALEALAVASETEGKFAAAAEWWRRAAAADMLSARIARSYMEALAKAGDREAAIKHAHVYQSIVRSELDTEPDPDIAELAERLRSNRDTFLVSTEQTRPAVAPSLPLASSDHNVGAVAIRAAPRRTRTWITAGLAAVAAGGYLLLFGGNTSRGHSDIASGRFSRDDQILVGDFDAPSRDSLSARALSEALRGSLAGSRAVSIVSRAEVDRALARMQRPVTAQLDHTLVQELAARNGYEAVLTGAISPIGKGYVLSARLTTGSGKEIATLSESAPSADALIPAVDRLSRALRRTIGESASAIDSVKPLEQVTTASLRALQLYTQATVETREGRGNTEYTLALLRQAIAHDSAFAMAHRFLGIKLYLADSTQEALRELRLAERFSSRLTEIERLSALSTLHLVLRDYSRSADEAAGILRLDPKSLYAINQLGLLHNLLGRYEHAREVALARSRLDSTDRNHLIPAALYAGRDSEALAQARRFFARYRNSTGSPSSSEARRGLAVVHLATAQFDSAEYYAAPSGPSDAGDKELLALSQLARGQLRKALATMGARSPLTGDPRPAPILSLIAESNAAIATVIMTADKSTGARTLDALLASRAYHLIDPANRRVAPILALALGGRVTEARRELAAIEKSADKDVLVSRHPELSLARGAVALSEGRLAESIEFFRAASSSYSLAFDACRVCALPWLGRAYEAAGRTDSAVVVYERYLATGDPDRAYADGYWRAVVLRQLGNLHAQRGDTVRAIRRLEEFAALWSGADSELQPQVASARKRIGELRSTRITVATAARR